ncbi:hypothetical protein V8G54_029471, partial [Vigna mungo]
GYNLHQYTPQLHLKSLHYQLPALQVSHHDQLPALHMSHHHQTLMRHNTETDLILHSKPAPTQLVTLHYLKPLWDGLVVLHLIHHQKQILIGKYPCSPLAEH